MTLLCLTLARPYARALFSIAEEMNQVNSWLKILNSLTKIIKNERVVLIVNNPNISDEEIKVMLLDVLREIEPETDNIPKNQVENLLQLLMSEKRLLALFDIVSFYRQLLNHDQGIIEAEIISAFPLRNNQKEQIKKKMGKRLSMVRVKLKVRTNKSLLGGVIICTDNGVIDGSIEGKLTRLAENLRGNVL